ENGGERIAAGRLQRLITNVATFGLTMAQMDVREDAANTNTAIFELMRLAGLIGENSVDHDTLASIMATELTGRRPLIAPSTQLTPVTREVLDVLDVVRDAQDRFGEAAIDTWIISMTKRDTDLLGVLLLAKEAGLVSLTDGVARLKVVPLF